ncbi:site-specific DNA-methyltransferase [Rhodococcus qingshengii]|uniref:site-specific DNA-methyltransferase n=1 Tax=Rhodococcus qingshengii TaxID=334542 RepID=UPI0021BA4FA1|nr:site-specific DNA-methyltransferase [Rhodococcus qingshengii]UXF65697.1 site-specific DNA-methyltransferase [Rhodococcus qingshengii]
MLDRLQDALRAGEVNLTREGYELKFLGKSYAKYLTSTRTETVVVPDLEHNAEGANAESGNLYIVGDNIDALKHLLGSYSGQVKCIYIDPPYNTGSDGFVYVDDFGFTVQELVRKIGLSEDEAKRVIDLQGKSSHSAWLTFMYPRLELAKQLLADDGVIFISIDDNEQTNLKALCDEVFGEQNAVANLVWKSKSGGANDSGQIAVDHEYVLAYAKNAEAATLGLDPLASATTSYNRSDENGRYSLERLDKQNLTYSESMDYVLVGPDGAEYYLEHKDHENPNAIWRWSKGTVAERMAELVFENGRVYTRNYEKDAGKPRSLLTDERFGRSRTGSTDIANLFDRKTFFKNPKPVKLIAHLVRVSTRPDSLVLDFFSGSATTAEAVMAVNAEDGGARRSILVQLHEPVVPSSNRYSKAAYAAGYRHIDEIGRARVARAAASIEAATRADIDYGFRLYRLEETSERTLDELQAFDPTEDGTLLAGDFVSKFDSDGTPGREVALSTWLLQDGFGLTPEVQAFGLAEYELRVCGDSAYVIEPGLTSEDVLEIVSKVENGELEVNRLVVFAYSMTFSVMHELKKNLASLKSGRTVSVIERF